VVSIGQRPDEVDQVYMLVRLVRAGDVFDEYRVRRGQLNRVGKGMIRRGGDDLADQAGLLTDFAEGGLDRVFVGLYVATGRHPLLESLVPMEERGAVVNDESGRREMADRRTFRLHREQLTATSE